MTSVRRRSCGQGTRTSGFGTNVPCTRSRWNSSVAATPFRYRCFLDELTHGDEAGVSIHDEMAGVFQESVMTIGEIPADLFRPPGIEPRRDPDNPDAASFQAHRGENVDRHQSVPRPGFRCSLESNFFATSSRCQRRIVSGIMMVANSSRALRPVR